MIIRTLALTTLFLFGLAAYTAAQPNRRSDPSSAKIENNNNSNKNNNNNNNNNKNKDKYKEKGVLVVSVPDGDPSSALLLTMGAVALGVFTWRRRTANNPERLSNS